MTRPTGRIDRPDAPALEAAVRCSACGEPFSEADSACPRCGEPLVHPERKLVTLLFADLSGYTAFAASLDPEEVFGVVRPWMTTLRLVVESHGGTVPQVMGDGFMAVFGVPTAHEDDAERAVRAGLALVREAADLDRRQAGIRFPGLHVGVNSGEVIVVGSREASGFAVVGDPVNVTARLADLASTGEVLVGGATRELTVKAIRFARRRLLAAKGVTRPIAAYPALGVRPTRRPTVGGRSVGRLHAAPFVDRVGILRRLIAEARETQRTGRARVRAIVDEPGVGKTRLAEELRARLPESLVLIGTCHPYGQRLPLTALAEAVAAGIGMRRGLSPARLRQGVRRFVREGVDEVTSPAMEAQLETLLGLPPVAVGAAASSAGRPGGVSLDARAAVRPVIRALAGGRPVVVVLDDVHWADPDLLALLSDVRRSPWSEPVLFLALGRPEPDDWYRALPRVRLGGLPAAEARRILAGVLGGPAPPSLAGRIVERAGGNPLFLEESARMLVETGALVRAGPGWQAMDPSAIRSVPDSLRMLVAARLDALPADEKQALQDASIAGEVTWDGLIAHIADQPGLRRPGSSVREAVRRLEARDLLRARPVSQVPGAVELEFKHAVIRDVAYESLPLAERARRHRATAEWLREHLGEPATASIAHQYERAWELGRSRTRREGDPALARLAAEYLRRWGDAVFAFHPRLAETLYDRGLQVSKAEPGAVEPDLVARLLVGRAEGLGELGRHHEAIQSAQAASSLVATAGPSEIGGLALLALGRARSNLGEVRPARALIEEALELFRSTGNVFGQARALHRLGEACRFDDFATETSSYRRAFRLYRAAGARADAAMVAEDLAYLLTVSGGRDFQRWFRRAMRLVEQSGDERSRAALSRAWAYAAWYRGDLDDALRAAREARQPAADAGDRWLEVDTLLIEALVRSVAGPPAEAERLVGELVRIADAVGARHLRALALLAGARPALRAGHPGLAMRRLASARRTLAELGVAMEMAEVDLAEAAVHLERGAWDRVVGPATAGERRARANGWRALVPLGPLLRGRADLGAGRLVRARRELRRAARLAAALEAVGPLALAEAALEQVAILLDDSAAVPTPGRSRRDDTGRITFVEAIAIDLENEGLRLMGSDPRAATAALGRAVRAWSGLGATVWQARAERFRADALDVTGRTSAARAARRRCIALTSVIGMPAGPAEVLSRGLRAPASR